MEFRNVGRSGLRVSVVGLGCNNFGGRIDFDATQRVVSAALDHGITLFNTADMYGNRGGSEEQLGKALGARRQDVVIVSKFGKPMDSSGEKQGGSRRYVMSAVEASLRRLGTDWIDLYEMHEPDPRTPIDETLRALDDLVRQGKVRYIGCSNYAGWQLAQANGAARALGTEAFVACEDEWSLLARKHEAELFPAARAHGVGLLPYYPLSSGMLTGKYRRDAPPPEGARLAASGGQVTRFRNDSNFDRVEALSAFAESRGHSLLELAMSWLAGQDIVASVIAGATTAEQVAANVAATGAWMLSAEDRAEVDRLTL